MSQQQDQSPEGDADGNERAAPRQQQQQPQSEGRAGQGLESAMQHLREWEQRRAGNTGGKTRP